MIAADEGEPAEDPARPEGARAQPVFFPVSAAKLLVLSTCSFGLYDIYWLYRHWGFVKKTDDPGISPLWRAIFAALFCYSLFRRIKHKARALDGARLPAGLIAIGWILSKELWLLPGPYGLLTSASVLLLLPVQRAVNRANAVAAPGHDPNRRLTRWNLMVVIAGSILWILIAIGLWLPTLGKPHHWPGSSPARELARCLEHPQVRRRVS